MYKDIVITDHHIEVPIEVWVKIVAEMEHFRQAYMDLFKWYREREIPDFDFEQLFRKAIEVSKGEGQEDLYAEFSDSVRAKYEGSGESRERECSYCGATVIVIGKVSRPICMRCAKADELPQEGEWEGQKDLHDEYMVTVLRLLDQPPTSEGKEDE